VRVNDIPEIARLSVPEKLLFVEELWDSITADETSVPCAAQSPGGIGQKTAELCLGSRKSAVA